MSSGSRKADHLRINLKEEVQSTTGAGFDGYRFLPQALPELDLSAVSTETEFLGHRLRAPILISCMTGGVPEATPINRALAAAAEATGIAIGLGSGRALVDDPSLLRSFQVRDLAPTTLLLANLGASQLLEPNAIERCQKLVTAIGADGLVLHLNAVQEALQPEGTPRFAGLLPRIEHLCRTSEFPIIVKEVGFGIAPDDVTRLAGAGVAAVDVAGAGGTSWSEVERRRLPTAAAAVAAEFDGWGLPTAEAIRLARAAQPELPLIGSGGIRTGMEVATTIALGADLAGLAGPFLRAAADGPAAATDFAQHLISVLKIVMFALGTGRIDQLRGTPRLQPVGTRL